MSEWMDIRYFAGESKFIFRAPEADLPESSVTLDTQHSHVAAITTTSKQGTPMDAAPVTPQRSFLTYIIDSLGPGSLLLPLAGFISFVLIAIIVFRGRGAMSAAALVLLVPSPLLAGIMLALGGMISSFSVIAQSSVAPKPSELAEGYSTALIAPMTAFVVMMPGFLLAVCGSCFRALVTDRESAAHAIPQSGGQ